MTDLERKKLPARDILGDGHKMMSEKKEKLECWFGLVVMSNRALLPTRIETARGDLDVEPIRQFDYTNHQELIESIEHAICVGNPKIDAPPYRNKNQASPVEIAANAKSWVDLERKSIYFSISILSSLVKIKSWGRAQDGTWSDEEDTALDVRIPKENGAQGIADAILEHLRQRTDLPGLAL